MEINSTPGSAPDASAQESLAAVRAAQEQMAQRSKTPAWVVIPAAACLAALALAPLVTTDVVLVGIPVVLLLLLLMLAQRRASGVGGTSSSSTAGRALGPRLVRATMGGLITFLLGMSFLAVADGNRPWPSVAVAVAVVVLAVGLSRWHDRLLASAIRGDGR